MSIQDLIWEHPNLTVTLLTIFIVVPTILIANIF